MHINSEIETLLQIVKGNGNPVLAIATCDIRRLVQLAMRHKVVYPLLLFARKHRGRFTLEQFNQLEERSKSIALRSLLQLNELKSIAGLLNKNKIAYVVVKGPHLARIIYGRNASKESVDLDLMLVYECDLDRVHILLRESGYDRSNLNRYIGGIKRKLFLTTKREVFFYNREKQCAIDLHIRPGTNAYLTSKYFKGFFAGRKMADLEGTPVSVLSDEPYLVYLCYHASLHQFARLAWLMDIRAFLSLKSKTIDYSGALSFAKEINAERNLHLTFLLLKKYFGDEIPLSLEGQGTGSHIQSWRMKYLAGFSYRLLGREARYWQSARERFARLFYMMLLIRGIKGKADWLFGIAMRKLIKLI